MRGIVIGTGPSLRAVLPLLPRFDGLIFGPNNTFRDIRLDVWLACDPAWHALYSPVAGPFDKWHWDAGICEKYGYRYVEGVWHKGLWLKDKTKISLNHGSAPQLINLACHYGCTEIVLVGHDFTDTGQRHYFDDLSETPGEYPKEIRKHSLLIKPAGQYDMLAVYKEIHDTPGRPEIVNCTQGSKLPWFPFRDLGDFLERP